VYIGDSAIVSWGRTTGDPTGQDGPDATDGNQPRYNRIINNVARNFGIWEKQSSFYMQAKTSDSYIQGNVAHSGPRAGVNWNDSCGGNSSLVSNLIFSMCMESGDHGAYICCIGDAMVFVSVSWRWRVGGVSTSARSPYLTSFFFMSFLSLLTVGLSFCTSLSLPLSLFLYFLQDPSTLGTVRCTTPTEDQ
jgi:hypothetical protein